MIDIKISLLILVPSVVISSIVGRLSLYQRKYSGWYEHYFDVSKLIYLIQNSVLFFVSILILLLLIVAGNSILYDIILLTIIILLYIIIVIIFRRGNKARKAGQKSDSPFFSWFFRFKKKNSCKTGNGDLQYPSDPSDNPETKKRTPKSMLLRFISIFSLTFFVCICSFFCLLLFSYNADTMDAQVVSFYGHFQELRSIEWIIVLNFHFEFLLPTFLLTLTSLTGLLIAAISIDYSADLDPSELPVHQRTLKELKERIEKR